MRRRSFLLALPLMPAVLNGCGGSASAMPETLDIPEAEPIIGSAEASMLQQLIDAAAASGVGVVNVPPSTVVSSTIHVRAGVSLVGAGTGRTDSANGKLIVSRDLDTAFVLYQGSSIKSLGIHRDGVVFGQADTSGFGGNAIVANGDDVEVSGCMITGFAHACRSVQFGRAIIHNNKIDCLNGIWLHNVYDISRITDNHCWPFVTVGWANANERGVSPASANREGVAYRLTGVNDWTQLRGNFSYAYRIGYEVADGSDVTLVQCGADGAPGTADNTGFYIHGRSTLATLQSCQCAGNRTAFHFDLDGAVVGSGNTVWGIHGSPLRIDRGDASRFQFIEKGASGHDVPGWGW
ncbi:hypothetical protein [Thiothrix winogradskyi]|uniref:Right handed beta helix domain-containing protein n=1 Tax=Thiothrix winogradskyi TaxID=96472 RepID=A0ABY3T4T8_9GAMM|nr:hypothetical protein [Thiothrix winogradskyi]UJS26277.1 hypothetical protein L2Y54_09620 [Thiothrix winogradskyi]